MKGIEVRERTKNPSRHTQRVQRRKVEERSLPKAQSFNFNRDSRSDAVPDNWGNKKFDVILKDTSTC